MEIPHFDAYAGARVVSTESLWWGWVTIALKQTFGGRIGRVCGGAGDLK